jgi:hypothetical protein
MLDVDGAPKDFAVRLIKKRSEYFVYLRAFLSGMAVKDEAGRHSPSVWERLQITKSPPHV